LLAIGITVVLLLVARVTARMRGGCAPSVCNGGMVLARSESVQGELTS
jgi:hypothetical protein